MMYMPYVGKQVIVTLSTGEKVIGKLTSAPAKGNYVALSTASGEHRIDKNHVAMIEYSV